MFVNNRWEFLLRGSRQTLWNLSHSTGSGYFHVYEVLNDFIDCSVDDYRFKSIFCDNQDDYQVVWQIGYELISLFNGASLLFDHNFCKIVIEDLYNDATRQTYCENELSFDWLEQPDISPENITAELLKTKSNIRLRLINKAIGDKGIYLILKYFNMEQGWDTYYKILESVESLSEEANITLSVDKVTRTSFTNTANNYSLSGIYSRHGLKINKKVNKTSAMKIDEAHNFIRHIAQQYVKGKLEKTIDE